jgi:tight adherence protein C
MTFQNPTTIIAIVGSLSAFCIAVSLVPSRNPLAMRIEKMQQLVGRSSDNRFARIEEIVTAEPQGRIRERLMQAGWYNVTPSQYAMRAAAGLGFGLFAGLLLFVFVKFKVVALLLGLFIALLGWRMPKIALDRAIKARHIKVQRAMADFLDMLSGTVRAGLGLNAALVQSADVTSGPLEEELRSALAEIRLGRERSEALQSMADRVREPQLVGAVSAIVQAEKLGANIAMVLHQLAKDSREYRWSVAEERAAKLPTQMIIPMALLMIPSLYIMIFGPIIAAWLVDHQ